MHAAGGMFGAGGETASQQFSSASFIADARSL